MLRVKIIMDTVDAAKEIEAITKNIRETAIKNTGEFTDNLLRAHLLTPQQLINLSCFN